MTLDCPHWRDPSQERGAPSPPVQVWRLCLNDLGENPLEKLCAITVPSEHERARKFRFDDDQRRHLAGRGLLRVVLAHVYGCAPQAPSIVEDAAGKPYVKELNASPLPEINIAHSADIVAVVCSHARPVGIDVESQTRVDDTEALAQRVLTEAERRRWGALPPADRPGFFIHLWTCKEAFLKGTGTGLRRAPDTIECRFEEGVVSGIEDAEGYRPPSPKASASQWSLQPFRVTEEIVGAVARHRALPASPLFADARRLVNTFSPC